jgi:transposase
MLVGRRSVMPKLLFARPPVDAEEERKVRKLAGARHAPTDWIMRAKMIAASWDGERTSTIAARLGCHMQTVRERLARFNAEGIDGLGDLPGAGRKRRITECERGRIIVLARSVPPGRAQRMPGRDLHTTDEAGPPQWTLDSLTEAARAEGIEVHRSQGAADPHGGAGALAAHPFLGDQQRCGPHKKGGGRRALHPPAGADHGDLRRRARPGDPAHVPARAGLVARRPPDQGTPGVLPRRRQDLGVRGSAHPRRHRGHLCAPSRNSDGWIGLLARICRANPRGPIRMVTDNLSSHTSGKVQRWLARHPRIQQVFIPKRACW